MHPSPHAYYTSPWIPAEWIKVHGFQAHGIWCHQDPVSRARGRSAGACAFAEAVSDFAEQHANDVMILESACDQMRRNWDVLVQQGHSRAFLFNIPATWQSSVAQRMYRSELERLGRWLEEQSGHAPKIEEFSSIVARRQSAAGKLLERWQGCSARDYAQAIAQFHWNGSEDLPERAGALSSEQLSVSDATSAGVKQTFLSAGGRNFPVPCSGDWKVARTSRQECLLYGQQLPDVRIAIVGGPLLSDQSEVLDAIEELGGRVALNATLSGERSLLPLMEPFDLADTPLEWLTRACFGRCADVFQRPNTRLYSWLGERLAARHVQAIVLWVYVGCDLWRAELPSLQEAFGLPVNLVETDGLDGCAPRNRSRIQALIEACE